MGDTAELTDVEPWTPLPDGVWRALRSIVEPYVGARFFVPGDPVPKKRRVGKGRSAFTPPATVAAEKRVKAAFRQALPGWEPEPDRTYGCLVEFRTSAGSLVDVDNAQKLILDALNKTFWLDDIQVGQMHDHLVRGADELGVEVWLFAVAPNGTKPTRLCECGRRYRTAKRMCDDCAKSRSVINQLIAGDDAAAQAAVLLDRDRRRVFSFITASMIGSNRSPSIAAIAEHAGISPHRASAVITTLISDGNLARDGRRLKIVKPLGAAA